MPSAATKEQRLNSCPADPLITPVPGPIKTHTETKEMLVLRLTRRLAIEDSKTGPFKPRKVNVKARSQFVLQVLVDKLEVRLATIHPAGC